MKTLDGIDIGYNNVKVISTNGRKERFATVVGTEQRKTFSIEEAQSKGLVITMEDGQTWYVGETALKQSGYKSGGGRRADWVESKAYHVLLCAAISELHKGTVSTSVVTGLPLEHYEQWSGRVRAVYIGQHRFRRNGGNWQTVTVEDCLVVTQPYGSLLDLALADNGTILDNVFATGIVAIADIGGVTLNLLVADNLEEMGQWTSGDGLGLLRALEAIAGDIKAAYGDFSPRAQEVAGWLAEGQFPYKDGKVDIMPYARPHLEPLAEIILRRMAEVWSEPGRYNAVLLTGGGSVALGRMLSEQMSSVYANVTVIPDPLFGNCRGYLKLARRLWGETGNGG